MSDNHWRSELQSQHSVLPASDLPAHHSHNVGIGNMLSSKAPTLSGSAQPSSQAFFRHAAKTRGQNRPESVIGCSPEYPRRSEHATTMAPSRVALK
eukprot:503269-Rhodomonas_salina.1